MKQEHKEKAVELVDFVVNFVSLVDYAANKHKFITAKCDKSKDGVSVQSGGKFLKRNDTAHHVTGVVYEPLAEDTDGEFMTAEEIRKAAYSFAKNGNRVDVNHDFNSVDGVNVVESYIAPCDMMIDGAVVKAGTWLMPAKIRNDDIWKSVATGELTGFSMAGRAKIGRMDVELSQDRSIFGRLRQWRKGCAAQDATLDTKGAEETMTTEETKVLIEQTVAQVLAVKSAQTQPEEQPAQEQHASDEKIKALEKQLSEMGDAVEKMTTMLDKLAPPLNAVQTVKSAEDKPPAGHRPWMDGITI